MICDAASGRGGSWNRDGTIILSRHPLDRIVRVASSGGTPVPVTPEGTNGHRFPSFLPDGKHFIYSSDQGILVASIEGGSPSRILPDFAQAFFVPGDNGGNSGYLLFRRQSALMALPFDTRSLKPTGDPLVLAPSVQSGANNGGATVAASMEGTLVYDGSAANGGEAELAWIDRAGRRLSVVGQPAAYSGVALSPDERSALAPVGNTGIDELWMIDLERGVRSRFAPASFASPVWAPDGRSAAYAYEPGGGNSPKRELHRRRLDNGADEVLLSGALNLEPGSFTPDGRSLLFSIESPTGGVNVFALALGEHGAARPVAATPFTERQGRVSPDGKWLATESVESGRPEVYVQPFPANGSRTQISTSGGADPHWRADGRELYYVAADQKLTAVSIATSAGGVAPGSPQPLFRIRTPAAGPRSRYSPSHDGQRFLVADVAGGEDVAPEPLTVVLNWEAGLKTDAKK